MFGFHLCSLDLRQNSEVHEQVVAELLAAGGVHDDYAGLDEDRAGRAADAELATPRPLARAGDVGELSRAGHVGARHPARSGASPSSGSAPAAIPHYVISRCESVSDVLEVAVLLREVGLARPGGDARPAAIVPLFETVDDLARGAHGGRRTARRRAAYRGWVDARAASSRR